MGKQFSLFLALLLSIPGISQYYDPKIGDTISAIHYSIHLTEVNTADQTIGGFTQVTLIPDIEGLDYIPLELMDLTVDSVFVDAAPQTYSHENDILRINSGSLLSAADTLTVTVYYQGQPFHEAWGGFHFDGNYAFNLGVGFESIPHNLGKTWFPCVDDFTDRATYDFHISVDTSLKAICGGALQETINNGDGTHTWIWNLPHRIPTYLASVAVGNYQLSDDSYQGMEETVPIQIYTRPSETSKVEGSFVNLKQILEWFETHFGPYPFSRVGYTGTAIGAMEHATNIAYPHFAINGGTSYEPLYTHELSHMWFGDRVTCSSAEDMWLNEGWATFCEIFYLNDLYSSEDYLNTMRHEHREVLRKAHITDKGYYALNDIPQEYTYGEHAYNKGATVANSLRGYLGDSIFFQAITAYLDTFAWQSVSSEEMEAFLTSYTGTDMNGFFEAWVYTPGTPHLSLDSSRVTLTDNGYQVDVWTRYQHKGAAHIADGNILEITFLDEDFNLYTDTVRWSGATGHSIKNLDFLPVALFADLYEKLNDATTDNYRYFTEPESYTFPDTYFGLIINELQDTALVQVTHNWVPPDSLKNLIEGLTLSDYRHWEISGVLPEGMVATGRFTYDRDGHLDGGLINSDSDSVVILYRPGAWDEWREVEQTRTGTWNYGYIDVSNLKTGEYTLAVWDKYTVGTEDFQQQEEIRIYPNPTRKVLNFEFPEKAKYQIRMFDAKGVKIHDFTINARRRSWKWEGFESFNGTVFVQVYRGRELVTIKKLIVTR